MISREDIQGLIERDGGERAILSAYLDTSVNSDNKRTHEVFLTKERSRWLEETGGPERPARVVLEAAFRQVERWLAAEFEEANRGVALFLEVGGDWLEAIQIPLPLPNRVQLARRPLLAPLLEVIEATHQHGIILVDREHLRMVSLYMDRTVAEQTVRTDPYPTPHDVQRGGYSAADFQRRKAEEVRHFFKDFAREVDHFVRRHGPDDLILMGTAENVKNFLEFLPASVREKVVHTGHAPVAAEMSELLERLGPFFEEARQREAAAAVDLLRDRVRQRHLAASGFRDTLEHLQEGKVQKLVIARGVEREGAQCSRCGFLLPRRDTGCPYCGGEVRAGVDLGEAIVRLAAEQALAIEFVPPDAVAEFDGVGALLRF